jgi:ATP-dependent DNA helicase PIF1
LNFQLGLVNGVCGEILELANSYVIVRFDNGQKVKLEACKFEYAEGENILAKRFQIPLVVAYAITIHKAQGLTLDEVVINFRKAFSPGQVYVALSRVKSLNGLYITGYDYRKLAPDSRVRYFYSDLLQRQYQEIIEHDYVRLFA